MQIGRWWVCSDLMGSGEVIVQFIMYYPCILFTILMYNSSLRDIFSIIYDRKFVSWQNAMASLLGSAEVVPHNSSDTLLGPRQVSRTFPCSHLTLSLALSFACLRWITVLASTLSGQKKSALFPIPWCPSPVIILLLNLFEQCEARFTPLTEFCCSSPLCRCLVNPSVFS